MAQQPIINSDPSAINGIVTISPCDIKSVSLTATTFGFPLDPSVNNLTWKWYVDGEFVFQEQNTPVSGLPENLIEPGTWIVKLYINLNLQPQSLPLTINFSQSSQVGCYSGDNPEFRTVSGDFDHDGKEDDLASFYYYGNNTSAIHVWKSNGSSFSYQGDDGWWLGNSFNADKIKGRVVSGDFDQDGFVDDIAVFYDYGNWETKILVFESTGTEFVFSGYQWVSGAGNFGASNITGRVVSGDFDHDGFKDDIAAFYDYGNWTVKMHVWTSNLSDLNYSGIKWSSNDFGGVNFQNRVVSGDFDSDGFHDDISAIYNGNGWSSKIYRWESDGNNFNCSTKWTSNDFENGQLTGKVVSGDFDNDGNFDDIGAFYFVGDWTTKLHVWKSSENNTTYNGVLWQSTDFDGNQIIGKVASGDFDGDGIKDDITAIYDKGNTSVKIFVWRKDIPKYKYQPPFHYSSFWSMCCLLNNKNINTDKPFKDIAKNNKKGLNLVTVSPNPNIGNFTIYSNQKDINYKIINLQGKTILEGNINKENLEKIDLSSYPKGIYIIVSSNDHKTETHKIVVQ